MNLTKILTIVFVVISIGLAYFLVDSIRTDINEERRIATIEANIIEKLKMIRDAQVAYQAVNGNYTSDWDKLINFVDTGKIYITQRREHIITLDYGADSVVVSIDTLGSVNVIDSLFSSEKYPNFQLERLPYIPGNETKKFDIFADEINKGGVNVDVFEVKDPEPVNPARLKKNSRGPLRVGSRTEVTTAGNWE
jgi:hypothetical protein